MSNIGTPEYYKYFSMCKSEDNCSVCLLYNACVSDSYMLLYDLASLTLRQCIV